MSELFSPLIEISKDAVAVPALFFTSTLKLPASSRRSPLIVRVVLYSFVSMDVLCVGPSSVPFSFQRADGVGTPLKSTWIVKVFPATYDCGVLNLESYSSLGNAGKIDTINHLETVMPMTNSIELFAQDPYSITINKKTFFSRFTRSSKTSEFLVNLEEMYYIHSDVSGMFNL